MANVEPEARGLQPLRNLLISGRFREWAGFPISMLTDVLRRNFPEEIFETLFGESFPACVTNEGVRVFETAADNPVAPASPPVLPVQAGNAMMYPNWIPRAAHLRCRTVLPSIAGICRISVRPGQSISSPGAAAPARPTYPERNATTWLPLFAGSTAVVIGSTVSRDE